MRPSTILTALHSQPVRLGKQLSLRIQVSSFEATCRMVEADIGTTPESAAVRHSRTLQMVADEPWAIRERSLMLGELDALPGTIRALIATLMPKTA